MSWKLKVLGPDVSFILLFKVPRMDKRVMAIAKLGYRKCVIPKTSEKLLKPLNLDIEILPCNNLKEFINTVFRPEG
jgi:DNA repair protein RadA/Sms